MSDEYEVAFYRALRRKYRDWRSARRITLPSHDDGPYALVSFMRATIADFLELDVIEVDRLFRKRYHGELVSYFIEHYSPRKAPRFAAFVCHLVFEDDPSLFFSRIEVTGRICGNWAVGHIKSRRMSKLLMSRFHGSQGRHGFAELYHDKYRQHLGRSRPPEDTMNGRIAGSTSAGAPATRPGVKTVLAVLLGASVAEMMLVALEAGLFGARQVWVQENGQRQAMFTVGYAPGSVRIYGFCMQQSMPGPSGTYRLSHRDDLADELQDVHDRASSFVTLFVDVMAATASPMLRVAAIDDGRKIWLTLQRFFWLLTQPYLRPLLDVDETWQDFTYDRRATSDHPGVRAQPHRDDDLVAVTGLCLKSLERHGIPVFRGNEPLHRQIIEQLS